MRFCVPIPCFFGKMNFADAIRKVHELGFDAVETYNWKVLDVDSVRAALEETGVELMSMCTSEFNLTDPEKRELWLAGLKESCEAANKLGVKRLITMLPKDAIYLQVSENLLNFNIAKRLRDTEAFSIVNC